MPYRIEFTPRASKEFKALGHIIRKRIAARVDALADNPRPASSTLLEASDRWYRIRVGDYRVIYQVEDRTVLVVIVRVGHRRDGYR